MVIERRVQGGFGSSLVIDSADANEDKEVLLFCYKFRCIPCPIVSVDNWYELSVLSFGLHLTIRDIDTNCTKKS